MRFRKDLTSVYRRLSSDVTYTRIKLSVKLNVTNVYAVCGNYRILGEALIQRGNAELSAELLSADDGTAYRKGTPEKLCGLGNLAFFRPLILVELTDIPL